MAARVVACPQRTAAAHNCDPVTCRTCCSGKSSGKCSGSSGPPSIGPPSHPQAGSMAENGCVHRVMPELRHSRPGRASRQEVQHYLGGGTTVVLPELSFQSSQEQNRHFCICPANPLCLSERERQFWGESSIASACLGSYAGPVCAPCQLSCCHGCSLPSTGRSCRLPGAGSTREACAPEASGRCCH